MNFSSLDIPAMARRLDSATQGVIAAYRNSGPHSPDIVSPELLGDALGQFMDVLKRIDADHRAAPASIVRQLTSRTAQAAPPPSADGAPADDGPRTPDVSASDITELGDYGLSLIQDMSQWAAQLHQHETRGELDRLAVPIALWTARHGGYINTLEPVVNSLALLANSTQAPAELAELSRVMGEIIAAVAPSLRQDLERGNPGRPWRILNLNRGIVATRSHDPALMDLVFGELVHLLPDDASVFFKEGMQQMEALDYPPPVREVMANYYRKYTVKTLH